MKPYYQDDMATIYHGDCREIIPQIGKVDLVVTSPPYNCGMDYGGYEDRQTVEGYLSFIEEVYRSSASILNNWGYSCWNIPNFIGSREEQVWALDTLKPIMDRYLRFIDLIVWVKGPNTRTAWGNPTTTPRIRPGHEWILVHSAVGGKKPDRGISIQEWASLTQNPWNIPAVLEFSQHHPATFPPAVPHRLAKLYSFPGAIILDPFMGCATTLRAAKDLGKRSIGIELNEKYCEIAAQRLSQEILPFV